MENPPSEPPSSPPSEPPTEPPTGPTTGDVSTEAALPAAKGGGPPRWVWIATGVAVLVVVVGVIAVAASSGSDPGYDDTVRERFIAACTAEGGDPVRPSCECIYTKVEADIPFDRFEEIDAELAEQANTRSPGAPLELPADIEAIRVSCVVPTS